MIRNYFKVAIRNLIHYKGYSIINILGLSVGLASAILILFYVIDETSYENYHKNADNIYRISLLGKIAGQEMQTAVSCVPIGPSMTSDFPEVKNFVRLLPAQDVIIRYGDRKFVENNILFVDSTYSEVFTVKFLKGDGNNFLNKPNTIAITERTAKKYFGSTDPMGKTIEMGNDNTVYEITHIIENSPTNSHFHYDFLVPFINSFLNDPNFNIWITNNNYSYVLLQDQFPPSKVVEKFPGMIEKYIGPEFESILGTSLDEFLKTDNKWAYQLTPIKDIHLHSNLDNEIEVNGSMSIVYVFSLIAIFLIIIACINFMNLSTARSANRSKEVGVRKVVGSTKPQLMFQFLTESIVITFIALLLAVFLVEIVLPHFNNFTNKSLDINYFKNPLLVGGIVLLGILVGFLAGSYPAIYLAAFKPIKVLKSSISAGAKKSTFRNILVVFQFVITIVLFICTFIVYQQLNYINNKDLGFEKEGLLVINRARSLGDNYNVYKETILKNPCIKSASYISNLPGQDYGNTVFIPEGLSIEDGRAFWFCMTDYDFAETMDLKIEKGRFFSKEFASDSLTIVVNDAAIKASGYSENPLGKKLEFVQGSGQDNLKFEIIGAANFNFESLHQNIRPLVMLMREGGARNLIVRIEKDKIAQSIEFLKNEWDKLVINQPFTYSFLKDDLEARYQNERKTGIIFTFFSVLAIFIASLGLFGLASFVTEQRTKEIGIRKALGASVNLIIKLLSKEVVILILISSIVAWPIAYFFMNKWLQSFAFRIDLSIGVFIISSIISLLIAMFTIGYRAYAAAIANPAESLRDE